MENWRDRVMERERDPVRNCKRCVHYLPDEDNAPVCLLWSRTRGRVERIGTGYSGERNDAPFCQSFKVRDS